MPEAPDNCPVCGQPVAFGQWIEERQRFLVECPQCTTFTITERLANRFRCLLEPDERRLVAQLSRYLQHAHEDDDRDLTEDSWVSLANQR